VHADSKINFTSASRIKLHLLIFFNFLYSLLSIMLQINLISAESVFKSTSYTAGLKKILNSCLSFGQTALTFCLLCTGPLLACCRC